MKRHSIFRNSLTLMVIGVVVLVMTPLPAAWAISTYWQVTTGNWSTDGNWTAGEPTSDDYAYINNGGTTQITQSGEICLYLYLGEASGESGTVELSSGNLLVPSPGWGWEYIGYEGTGTFTQTGGTNNTNGLLIAMGSGSIGTYELSAGGNLSSTREAYVGYGGTGTFTQTGGTYTASEGLTLGSNAGANGSYELSGGSLSNVDPYSWITVGEDGTGTFTQTGGTNNTPGGLHIAHSSGSNGTYELSGDGSLSADNESVGWEGTGTFTQAGGTHTIGNDLYIGYYSGSSGTYTISDGVLSAGSFFVGINGDGMLDITGAGAEITVSNLLSFGANGAFAAVAGASIHMTGANFENLSTNEAELAGLANLELIFEGGPADTDDVEVACEDKGAVTTGYFDNFALRKLTIGGADVGMVRLVDNTDNGNRGGTGGNAEALYVNSLVLGAGSVLDLNNLHLYWYTEFVDNGGTILNGQIQQVKSACQVSPTSLDFGGVAVGCHIDKTFTIANIDTAGGEMLSGSVTESCDHYSIVSGEGPYELAPGESLIVAVRFEPSTEGAFSCTLETGDTLCCDVSCTGVGAICWVWPTALDFGGVALGGYLDKTFTITNIDTCGGGTILSGSVTESCDHYSIVSGEGPYELAPGESLIVAVRFEPSTEGAFSCTLETGDALCCDVSCTGVGGNPFIRGDYNCDGVVDTTDANDMLAWLFGQPGGYPPPCKDAADFDDDGGLFLKDAADILEFAQGSGPPPPPPYPGCGFDPTPDDLDCAEHHYCMGPYIAGDINGDGTVTEDDASSLVYYLYGGGEGPPPWQEAANVNEDGYVDISDAMRICYDILPKADMGKDETSTLSNQGYGKLKVVCSGSRDPGEIMHVVIVAQAENNPVEAIGIEELLYPACLTPVGVSFYAEAAQADTVGWSYETTGSVSCEDSNTFRLGILFSFECDPTKYLSPGPEKSIVQIDFQIREDASLGTYPVSIPEHKGVFSVLHGSRHEPTIEIVDSIRVGLYPYDEGSALPKTFSLSQNYPNPFNPITEIKYGLPKECHVRLVIYNTLGQRVATLVDGKQKAGYKTARWDASSLSSGIYFYRLQARDFVQTRKMVLIR